MSDQKTKRIDDMRKLIIEMAAIIRNLDFEGGYSFYWLNDGTEAIEGPYCSALEQLEMQS